MQDATPQGMPERNGGVPVNVPLFHQWYLTNVNFFAWLLHCAKMGFNTVKSQVTCTTGLCSKTLPSGSREDVYNQGYLELWYISYSQSMAVITVYVIHSEM